MVVDHQNHNGTAVLSESILHAGYATVAGD